MRVSPSYILLLLWSGCGNEPPVFSHQDSGVAVSLRGLAVVDDHIAWASGANGTFLRTADGGKTWQSGHVPDADALDFRDVDAVDEQTAYLLSAGEPASIYKTTDGGARWTEQYSNPAPGVFFDSMAFWDGDIGLAFSDPIEGRFLIVRTTDGGATWERIPSENLPEPKAGEAGFAASGTMVAVEGRANAWIGTGGATARVLRSTDRGWSWSVSETPMKSGDSSTGIFSLTFWDELNGIAVGGDYQKPEDHDANVALTTDGGVTWKRVETPPSGYRSGVAFVPGTHPTMLVAVGASGTDVSYDGGKNWSALGGNGYHAVGFSPSGAVGWAVGEQGRIAKITIPR